MKKIAALVLSLAACVALGFAAAPARSDDVPIVPPGQALPPEIVPGAGLAGVAGEQATMYRFVRATGLATGFGRAATTSFRLDLRRGPGNKIVVSDRRSGVEFRALRITSMRWAAEAVQIQGLGLANGHRVPFTAVAVDNAYTPDVFRISWARGASLGGALRQGSVVIH